MEHYKYIKRVLIAAASVFTLLALSACEDEIGSPPGGPPAPNNLTAEVEGGSVRLRWNGTEPEEYRLERSYLVSGNFSEIAKINGDTTEYLDTSVIFGDTYFYRVRAYDSTYVYPFSDYSNEVEITVE
jgi:hypothetical protein